MFKSIVVGTDGSAPANAAVNVAAELARAGGGTLHIVSAYKQSAAALMASGVAMPPVDVELEGNTKTMLDNLAKNLRREGGNVQTYACPGEATEAILGVAETHAADLIVVGNKGMSGARRLLGSVPNTVSHRADCSVLIVQTR